MHELGRRNCLTLSCLPAAAPSLLTANGAVEFSVSPDLSHLAVSCVFSTPPVARRGHLRQGSSASRTSGDDRHASGMSPFLFDSDIAGSRGVSDGNGLHFINILKYVYQHPGHVNPKVGTIIYFKFLFLRPVSMPAWEPWYEACMHHTHFMIAVHHEYKHA